MALEYVEKGSTVVWEVKTAYDRIPVIFALGDPKGLKNNGTKTWNVLYPQVCVTPNSLPGKPSPGGFFPSTT